MDEQSTSIDAGLPGATSPHWHSMEPSLHTLTDVVCKSSATLERTTLLTWIYRNRGVMSVTEIAEKVPGDQHQSRKMKIARTALKRLQSIGAIELERRIVSSVLVEQASITQQGMLWMVRAWRARNISFNNNGGSIRSVHLTYLGEEEEGDENDPLWIETMAEPAGHQSKPEATGEISRWIGPGISSVFDLHRSNWLMSAPTTSSGALK
jgi:hypothetical protein